MVSSSVLSRQCKTSSVWRSEEITARIKGFLCLHTEVYVSGVYCACVCGALANSLTRVILLHQYAQQLCKILAHAISKRRVCLCVCLRACLRADFISYCFFQRLHRTISIPVRPLGLLWDVSSFEDDTSPQARPSVREWKREREGRETLGLCLEVEFGELNMQYSSTAKALKCNVNLNSDPGVQNVASQSTLNK